MKNPVLPIEKFPSLVLSRDEIMLQNFIIKFSLYIFAYRRLKTKENFKLLALKVVAVAYVPNVVIQLT